MRSILADREDKVRGRRSLKNPGFAPVPCKDDFPVIKADSKRLNISGQYAFG